MFVTRRVEVKPVAPRDGRCISTVSEDLGYIDQRHGRFRQIKTAGDRGRRLPGSGFGAHFTRIENTEKKALSSHSYTASRLIPAWPCKGSHYQVSVDDKTRQSGAK